MDPQPILTGGEKTFARAGKSYSITRISRRLPGVKETAPRGRLHLILLQNSACFEQLP